MRMIVAALAATLVSGIASAQTYVETNAGQTLATASDTTTPATGVALTAIIGNLSSLDVDLYRIYISAPGSFSASTNNVLTNNSYTGPGGGALDTALFLFDSTGHAVATNDDDADGQHLTSTLSASNALLSSLVSGFYYLGISTSGNEPVNSVNQLLFSMGLSTETRGPAGGLNPTTLSAFVGQSYDDTPGAYQISLTGVTAGAATVAPVPEPATWTLMLAGFGGVGYAMRRRKVAYAA